MNYIIETERLKLRELTLDDTDNLPSRHVAERNGMTFVKSFTKTVMGKVVEDEVLYMKSL